MTLPETISAYVLQNHKTEYVPLCGLYRASIDLDGYTYARVRRTEKEAVEALIRVCCRSVKWQKEFKTEKSKV